MELQQAIFAFFGIGVFFTAFIYFIFWVVDFFDW